ncbi:hypothetical protein MSG28_004004 [Choristoneura fumiferana]|uniref:Uncharacterized protein n=1 Tax=Choristoneura fumiferana TaxID=7141 RepID=A0ACC0KHD7_CHOFU|nr:hypothetical protein MSG28_004004 [Choristoneura fumiferana]
MEPQNPVNHSMYSDTYCVKTDCGKFKFRGQEMGSSTYWHCVALLFNEETASIMGTLPNSSEENGCSIDLMKLILVLQNSMCQDENGTGFLDHMQILYFSAITVRYVDALMIQVKEKKIGDRPVKRGVLIIRSSGLHFPGVGENNPERRAGPAGGPGPAEWSSVPRSKGALGRQDEQPGQVFHAGAIRVLDEPGRMCSTPEVKAVRA